MSPPLLAALWAAYILLLIFLILAIYYLYCLYFYYFFTFSIQTETKLSSILSVMHTASLELTPTVRGVEANSIASATCYHPI